VLQISIVLQLSCILWREYNQKKNFYDLEKTEENI